VGITKGNKIKEIKNTKGIIELDHFMIADTLQVLVTAQIFSTKKKKGEKLLICFKLEQGNMIY